MAKTNTRRGGNHLAKGTGFVGAYIDQGTFDVLKTIAKQKRAVCAKRPVCRHCKSCRAVKELVQRVLSTVKFLPKGGNHPRP
jgi:hypothetical protein